jgi:hypothetical protein
MPVINSTEFGSITIDGQKYGQVLILGKEVQERDYDKLKEIFGTSHKIGDWEKERILANNPKLIIVGTGQDGALEMDQGLAEEIKKKGIELIVEKTPRAIEIYNERRANGEAINALIHTTC